MGSLISASLIGVDKSNDDGKDYVSMIRQFFNKKNGTNLILNGLDRKAGESFWYEIWPAMAYSMLVDLYPQKTEMQEPMKITVDNWYAAIQDLVKVENIRTSTSPPSTLRTVKGTIIKYGVNRMQPQDLLAYMS